MKKICLFWQTLKWQFCWPPYFPIEGRWVEAVLRLAFAARRRRDADSPILHVSADRRWPIERRNRQFRQNRRIHQFYQNRRNDEFY